MFSLRPAEASDAVDTVIEQVEDRVLQLDVASDHFDEKRFRRRRIDSYGRFFLGGHGRGLCQVWEQLATNNFEHTLRRKRANAISELSKTVPLRGGELKPIRETL